MPAWTAASAAIGGGKAVSGAAGMRPASTTAAATALEILVDILHRLTSAVTTLQSMTMTTAAALRSRQIRWLMLTAPSVASDGSRVLPAGNHRPRVAVVPLTLSAGVAVQELIRTVPNHLQRSHAQPRVRCQRVQVKEPRGSAARAGCCGGCSGLGGGRGLRDCCGGGCARCAAHARGRARWGGCGRRGGRGPRGDRDYRGGALLC